MPNFPKIPLEPSAAEWSSLVEEIKQFLNTELTQLASTPITSSDAGLDQFTPTGDLTSWLQQLFATGFNTSHPGFMGYIPGGGLVTSALADWIVKTLNRYGTAHFAAPKLADLEYKVIQTFAQWVGYDDNAAGVLTTGGSLANFTALVTARRKMLPENFLQGVLYCSNQAHHSVMKAANLAGFSARNMRILEADENFKICPQGLAQQIQADKNDGLQPFMVIASAGTTNTGNIDPLPEMSAICKRHRLWFHVDAAYGGSFVLTQRGRQRLAGMSEADSITLDPHKGLFLPYGTGSILVKDRNALIEAHEMRGDYMPELDHSRAHLDPFSLSVELSREHRGLKIWLPLMLHGIEAFETALDEKLDLTQYLMEEIQKIPEIQVLNKAELTTIAFSLRKGSDAQNMQLLDTINQGDKVFISGTTLRGKYALRASILGHRTHRIQIDELLLALRAAVAPPQMG
ncbi:MAG: aromatic-L-amino-acid decarboxylase [Halioglobus sp.]|jgi:aromatic-L-amino-acid decarboxylase